MLGCTLGGMRLQVEVQPEDEEPLRRLARERAYPALRYAASALLHLKIREEELGRPSLTPGATEVPVA